jgi:hypothetical protein
MSLLCSGPKKNLDYRILSRSIFALQYLLNGNFTAFLKDWTRESVKLSLWYIIALCLAVKFCKNLAIITGKKTILPGVSCIRRFQRYKWPATSWSCGSFTAARPRRLRLPDSKCLQLFRQIFRWSVRTRMSNPMPVRIPLVINHYICNTLSPRCP